MRAAARAIHPHAAVNGGHHHMRMPAIDLPHPLLRGQPPQSGWSRRTHRALAVATAAAFTVVVVIAIAVGVGLEESCGGVIVRGTTDEHRAAGAKNGVAAGAARHRPHRGAAAPHDTGTVTAPHRRCAAARRRLVLLVPCRLTEQPHLVYRGR